MNGSYLFGKYRLWNVVIGNEFHIFGLRYHDFGSFRVVYHSSQLLFYGQQGVKLAEEFVSFYALSFDGNLQRRRTDHFTV